MRLSIKRKLAGFLSLLMVFSIMMSGQATMSVRAEESAISVSFREGSAANGLVEILTNSSWIDYANADETQAKQATAVRIVPNTGYRIDWAGIRFEAGSNEVELTEDIKSKLVSSQGFPMESNTVYRLIDVEFRSESLQQPSEESGVGDNTFQLFYDDHNRDDGSRAGNVTVNRNNTDPVSVSNADKVSFTENEAINFTLTPPTNRAGVTPIVEIVVYGDSREVFGTDSQFTGNNKINLIQNAGQYSFSYTPTTKSGFEVNVWWSAFDRFGPGQDEFVVQVNVRGNGDVSFNKTSIGDSGQEPNAGENDKNIKYCFRKDIFDNGGCLTLAFNPTSGNFLDRVRTENAQYTTSSDPEEGWIQIINGNNNFTIDNGKYSYTINASDVPENSNIFIEAEFRSEDDHGGGNPQEPNPGQLDPTNYEGAKNAIEADRFAYYAAEDDNDKQSIIKDYLATELWYEYFNPGRPYAGMFDTHNETGEVVEGTIGTLKNAITLTNPTSQEDSEIIKDGSPLSYYEYEVLLHNEVTEGEAGTNTVRAEGKVYILGNPLDVVIATTYNDITSYKVETITESTNDVKVLANFGRDDRGDAMIDVFGNGVSAVGRIEGGSENVWGAHVTQEHSNLGDDSIIGNIGFKCFVAQEGFIGTKVTGSRNAAAWDFVNANVYEVSSQESSWAEVFYGNKEVTVESDGFGNKVIDSVELDTAKIPAAAATIAKIQEGTFTIQLNSGYDSIPIKVMYKGDTVTYYQTIHRIGLALGDAHSQGDSNNYVIWHGTDHTVKYNMLENTNHVVYASFYYRANNLNEVKPVNIYATIRYKDGTVERKNITSAITDSGTVVDNGDINEVSQNQDKVAGQGTDKYYDDFEVWSGSETDYEKIESVDIFAYEKSDDSAKFGGAKIGSGDGYTWEPVNRQ